MLGPIIGPPRCHGGPMVLVGAGFDDMRRRKWPYIVYCCQVCGAVVTRWPEGRPPWR
jgi:hypothetical protein